MPGPKRKLSPEQEQEIVARYSTGESALSISKDYGVNHQTICNTLERCSVAVRPELQKRRLTDQQRALVAEACLGGATSEEAARRFGTSPKTVLRILEAQNIRLPKGRPPR